MLEREFLKLVQGLTDRDLSNDAAFIEDLSLIITTDSMVEGKHFLASAGGFPVAQKLLRVNLSDIASMGAVPLGYTLNLCWRKGIDDNWVKDFIRGLHSDQMEFKIELWGGDTVVSDHELSFSATLWGKLEKGEKPLTRSGIKKGHKLLVSGELGNGMIALEKGECFKPEPRLSLGAKLKAIATAACDISDGLYLDAQKMAVSSDVSLHIDPSMLPIANGISQKKAICAGDDYELLFSVAPEKMDAIANLSQELNLPMTEIGLATEGHGVTFKGISSDEIHKLHSNEWKW